MGVVDDAFADMPLRFTKVAYEVFKDLEADCVMCDWSIEIGSRQRGHGSSRLYIELKKEFSWYYIERSREDFAIYRVRNAYASKHDYEGGIIECIDYFRKNVLIYI